MWAPIAYVGKVGSFTKIRLSGFSVDPPGSDTHVSTDWRIVDAQNQVVWESLNDTVNLTELELPVAGSGPNDSSYLEYGQTYLLNIRLNGQNSSSSWTQIPLEVLTPLIYYPQEPNVYDIGSGGLLVIDTGGPFVWPLKENQIQSGRVSVYAADDPTQPVYTSPDQPYDPNQAIFTVPINLAY
jgi:hypothetical protein